MFALLLIVAGGVTGLGAALLIVGRPLQPWLAKREAASDAEAE